MAKTIILDPSAGRPEMKVFVGQAQFGKYTVDLRDTDGTQTTIASGNNLHDSYDTFSLPVPIANLMGKILVWTVEIKAPSSAAGQSFFASISISQDGSVLQNGLFEYDGPLDAAEVLIGGVKLDVQP